MSDTPQGPGWWQASDAKWYPPEQAAGAAVPPPPAGYGPPPQPGATPYGSAPAYGPPPQQMGAPMGYAPPASQGMNGCLKAFLIVLALLTVLGVIGAIVAVTLLDDAVDDFVDGDSDEANDVRDVDCDVDAAGNLRATITVENDSSERSNYILQVAWQDDDGRELTSSAAFINAVQPGDQESGDSVTSEPAPSNGDFDCEVTGVQRFSDEGGG